MTQTPRQGQERQKPMSTATRTQIEQVVPMSTKRSTDMAFQIEIYDRYGRWLNDWAGDPSDNVFATEAEAEAMLTELLRIFDAPADEDEYIPEYRLVEVTGDGEPVNGALVRYLNR